MTAFREEPRKPILDFNGVGPQEGNIFKDRNLMQGLHLRPFHSNFVVTDPGFGA